MYGATIQLSPTVSVTVEVGGGVHPDDAQKNIIDIPVPQNMISVAAGLASEGLSAWVYSIAPFCVARPFEQIRNDVALHGLPVKLVGNGGGFGYGVMGPTHHAIEDYGLLLTLPGFTVHAPVFDADITGALAAMAAAHGPTHLRPGRDERPPRCQRYAGGQS